MERIKKISDQGQISINDAELAHAGLRKGDLVVLNMDEGKYGKFISLYPPGEKHKKMVELYKQKTEENNNENPTPIPQGI